MVPATGSQRGIRSALLGIAVNSVLAVTKFAAGFFGNTYALIADAVESTADIFASLVVLAGLRVSTRDPDEAYPFGYGKAETIATLVVSLMLLAAAAGIGIEATREIRTPHDLPAIWTLPVLAGVMLIKWTLSRRVGAVAKDIGSTAVKADAWHHFSDALTSGAAFIGISVALVGSRLRPGSGWGSADDWAALFASATVAFNGLAMLRQALRELMDRTAGAEVVDPVRAAAEAVPGVSGSEKLAIRKTGMTYQVTIHVRAEPSTPLHEAHILGGKVKTAIRTAVPAVESVLVHMEPHSDPPDGSSDGEPFGRA